MTTFSSTALRGKVAIVTGAARGIGRAAAAALAEAGADIAGLDICAPASPISTFAPATRSDLDETGRAVAALGRHGITVNALVPGLIDTALTRHEDRYAQAIETGGKQPTGDVAEDEAAASKALAAKLPLGLPWLDAAAVAPAVVFLASGAAGMVSGTSLAVTGGDSANVTA